MGKMGKSRENSKQKEKDVLHKLPEIKTRQSFYRSKNQKIEDLENYKKLVGEVLENQEEVLNHRNK